MPVRMCGDNDDFKVIISTWFAPTPDEMNPTVREGGGGREGREAGGQMTCTVRSCHGCVRIVASIRSFVPLLVVS